MDIGLLFAAFIAGVLTVAAPCILPLLPVVIGGAALQGDRPKSKWSHATIITLSLAISVIVFTLLLKATTVLLGVPQGVWSTISGIIVILLGVYFLFPGLWDRFSAKLGLGTKTNTLMGKSFGKKGVTRDILIGASLGPVFSSCSPTYALIVALVLPQSFAKGFIYLLAYAFGLALVLFLLALLGSKLVKALGWLSNPHGLFKKVIGILFIIVGFSVLFGFDKTVQTYVLEQGWYDPIIRIEQKIEN
jgi:cytochrome c-type biogenesis protein